MNKSDAVFDAQPSNNRQAVDQSISKLKTVEGVRRLALPVAVLAAGVSAVSAPILFPVTAGFVAAALGIGEWLARKERSHLTTQLKNLKESNELPNDELNQLISTANRLTIGGSSN